MALDSPTGSAPVAATAAAPPVADKHTSFVQYVDQIHQMNSQYFSRMPSSASAITPFVRTPIPVAGPAGMALMPYQPTTPQTQPLTPDNLQKLYNSPYYPGAGYSRFPTAGGGAAFPHHQQQHRGPQPVPTFPVQQMRSASVPPGSYHLFFLFAVIQLKRFYLQLPPVFPRRRHRHLVLLVVEEVGQLRPRSTVQLVSTSRLVDLSRIPNPPWWQFQNKFPLSLPRPLQRPRRATVAVEGEVHRCPPGTWWPRGRERRVRRFPMTI